MPKTEIYLTNFKERMYHLEGRRVEVHINGLATSRIGDILFVGTDYLVLGTQNNGVKLTIPFHGITMISDQGVFGD